MQPATKRSKQRDAIINFLMTRKDHPTSRGDILKLSYDGGADRYDANVGPHYHFICKECGEVIDLKMDPIDHVNAIASAQFKGRVDENVTYFRGVCEKCLKKDIDNTK